MGFFKALWGLGSPPSPSVTHEELDKIRDHYDRKLRELDEALHALRADEPDLYHGSQPPPEFNHHDL